MKNVAFYDIPYLCGFVTDRSIAIDVLATPGLRESLPPCVTNLELSETMFVRYSETCFEFGPF